LTETEEKNDNGMILSETLINDKRRYYLDLRENQRGTFLRITQMEIQSGVRNSVALPSQGITQLHDALEEILDEFGEGYIEDETELPGSQTFRSDGKNFFFDPGHNARGDFLKITELKPSVGVRNTIALSVRAIPQFTQVLNKLYDDFHAIRSAEENVAPSVNEEPVVPAKKSAPNNEQQKPQQSDGSGSNNGTAASSTNASNNKKSEGGEQKGTVKA